MVIEGLASHIPITDTACAHLPHSHQSQTMNGKQMVIGRLASHISNTQQNQSQTWLESTSITLTHKNQPVKENGNPPTGIAHIKHTAESVTDMARVHIHHSHNNKKEPTNEGKSLPTNWCHTGSRHTHTHKKVSNIA